MSVNFTNEHQATSSIYLIDVFFSCFQHFYCIIYKHANRISFRSINTGIHEANGLEKLVHLNKNLFHAQRRIVPLIFPAHNQVLLYFIYVSKSNELTFSQYAPVIFSASVQLIIFQLSLVLLTGPRPCWGTAGSCLFNQPIPVFIVTFKSYRSLMYNH